MEDITLSPPLNTSKYNLISLVKSAAAEEANDIDDDDDDDGISSLYSSVQTVRLQRAFMYASIFYFFTLQV